MAMLCRCACKYIHGYVCNESTKEISKVQNLSRLVKIDQDQDDFV